MSAPLSSKCLHCKAAFIPCPTHRTTQRYCATPACRKASKAAAQARWRQQPQNHAYFRGPEHVERVRRETRKNRRLEENAWQCLV